jgi:ribose/xylose/arabinose/galactoside ABC-type transport system permease subunit
VELHTDTNKNTAYKMTKGRMSNETFITMFMSIVLIAFFGIACLFVPNFYLPQNMLNILTNFWYIIILGIGVTFIMITGNFDMSVSGIIAMTGVLAAYFCQPVSHSANASSEMFSGLGMPYWLAIVAALAIALLIGAINAFFIARLKVASIIITLGTMSVARGIGAAIAQGAQRNTGLPDEFKVLGTSYLPGTHIQISIVIMVLLVIVAVIIEKKTVFGRRTYLIGANINAARLSGIKVEKHLTYLYLGSAFLAGITGILISSSYISGNSGTANGYEFDALVVTLLGGTSVNGGFGSVLGTVVGALVLSVMTSAATGLLLSPDWQFILKGAVTFLAILAQRFALDKRAN